MRVSLGFIIYILVAVFTAIIKWLAKQGQTEKRRSPGDFSEVMEVEKPLPATDVFDEVEEYFSPLRGEEEEPEVSLRTAEDLDLNQDEPKKVKPKAKLKPRFRISARNLSQAIVMSEIVREPRVQRPWPNR
ncbi:MAG: hypothetical protein GX335_04840 [Firmicutes bacterium]|nr:hypothetical protein [Bacillota bacterium]